jgi:hypothetical protein
MVGDVLFILLFAVIACALCFGRQGAYTNIWVKGYPPVDYLETSHPSGEPWRWRKPYRQMPIPYNSKSSVGIRDTPKASSFRLRSELRVMAFVYPFSGIALIGFTLLLILHSSISVFLFALPIYLCLFGLGWICLQYGDRAIRIDLYPDRVEILGQFANFLTRTTVYQRYEILAVHGKLQSFWTMEKGQIQPDYKVIIQRLLLGRFPVNRTFRLRCDPSQGTWIVGGLKYWQSINP